MDKSIKKLSSKTCFESSLKRCEARNVSDLRRKTVSQFESCGLKGSVTKGR